MADLPNSSDLESMEKHLTDEGGAAPAAAPEPKKKAAKKKGGGLFGFGGGKKGKDKKKAAMHQPDVLWTVRVEQWWNGVWAQFKELVRGLGSPDRGTRRMSALFLLSFAGLLVVCVLSGQRYFYLTHVKGNGMSAAEKDAKHLSEFIGRQAEETKRRRTSLTLGDFTVELKKAPGQKEVAGVANMAEIEIVAECDSQDTCGYIGDFLPQARNQVTNAFTALDREEILSREGKRRLKKLLMEKLNLWLPKGKIENLYFAKLVIS